MSNATEHRVRSSLREQCDRIGQTLHPGQSLAHRQSYVTHCPFRVRRPRTTRFALPAKVGRDLRARHCCQGYADAGSMAKTNPL